MANAGILMHIRHLDTVGWERLVWGVPEEDSLGGLPKVVEILLNEAEREPVTTIVFGCGPSSKDGLSEGEYTKRYFLDRLPELKKFESLASRLSDSTFKNLESRLKDIIVTEKLARSMDEVVEAARIFDENGVSKVYQVTSPSHAPRCVQIQAAARADGYIPKNQQWMLVADDRCFEGFEPFSTLILEPPHRGDDPMIDFKPSLQEVMRSYQYGLSANDKKELIRRVHDFMQRHANGKIAPR